MSIHQFAHRCWELSDPADDDRTRHFEEQSAADEAIRELRDENPDTTASVHQLDAPCWVVECDGGCETALDEEGECWTFHCPSRAMAEQLAADFEWVIKPDPDSAVTVLAYCPEDAPEGGQVSSPTPEQQEAAGQLSIWDAGVPS